MSTLTSQDVVICPVCLPTDEDPGAPVEVRLERFTRTTVGAVFDPCDSRMLGIGAHVPQWLRNRSDVRAASAVRRAVKKVVRRGS